MNTGTFYADKIYSGYQNDPATLEKNVKENPASSIARFLLLYHYKKTNDPAFDNFLSQSSLYFNNHYWLQYQINDEQLIEETLPGSQPEDSGHFAATLPEKNVAVSIPPVETNPVEENTGSTGMNEETAAFNNSEEVAVDTEDEHLENHPVAIINGENDVENKEDTEHSHDAVEPLQDEIAFEPKEEILEEDEERNNASFDKQDEAPIAFEPGEPSIENTLTVESAATPEQPEERNDGIDVDQSKSYVSNAHQSLHHNTEDINTDDDVVAFEPLHTIDYFASQGIKLKEDALANDKLGQQVKSFTAWLKSMKKLHPGKLPEQNEVIEKIIQTSAEESNADAEVLTEAMAEVLIKQNKQEKAIEMYEKLSLLNPSKSTYFAAKIESLKTN